MYRPIDETWAADVFEAEEEEKITPKVTIKTDIICIAVYLQKKRRKKGQRSPIQIPLSYFLPSTNLPMIMLIIKPPLRKMI